MNDDNPIPYATPAIPRAGAGGNRSMAAVRMIAAVMILATGGIMYALDVIALYQPGTHGASDAEAGEAVDQWLIAIGSALFVIEYVRSLLREWKRRELPQE